MTQQQRPHVDVELERTYIRSCVRAFRPSHLANATERLAPADCYVDAHRVALETLHDESDARRAIDAFTFREAVLAHARGAGAVEVLDRLLEGGEVSKSVESMASKLRTMAKRRRRHELLTHALAASLDGRDDAVTEHALSVSIDAGESRDGEFKTAGEVVYGALEFFRSVNPDRQLKTGFALLDRAVGSLQPGSLTFIAGRTGSRKSSMMLTMAKRQAALNTPVAIVSTEDAETVWGPRIAAHYVGMNPEQIVPGMSDAVYAEGLAAAELASREPMHFAFEIQRGLNDQMRATRHMLRKNKCRVIYSDYLQAIGWDPGKDDERRLFVTRACSQLKQLCADHGAALVMGSQLSRPEKGREFKEPRLEELKESGDLENMAEIVILLWKMSDQDDAVSAGKVAKVKWTGRRPRFELVTHHVSGAVVDLREAQPEEPRASRGDGSWAR